MSRDVYRDCKQYATVAELKVAIEAAWARIPQEFIDNMLNSMPRRMQECVDAHGDALDY